MKLSVILCTHNPRADHLARTLQGLAVQSLPRDAWELLVVDNASVPPLAPRLDLSWHPAARVALEPVPGLVAARLRGIAEARGSLLVFVDDDNVLAADYLERAGGLAEQWPQLGAFGGQIHGEFEVPPSPWFAARLDRLAIREFTAEHRAMQPDPAFAPCGAGLCVRATVARHYSELVAADPRRRSLGRSGRNLGSGEDTDLVLTANELGFETGRFPGLQLTHLIPRARLTLRYFAKITRGHARAKLDLLALHPAMPGHRQATWAARRALWKWAAIDTVLGLLPARSSAP